MYINKGERRDAQRQLPELMVKGLFRAGGGLGVLALIFEIAADAFSVAAYQTLLAINGAGGRHDVAFASFTVLSIMLFLGVVPAYKGAAYLRPNSGGSGPLVEAIGPNWLRPLSWVATSLFFLDAVFTIVISSISASDVFMLILPELSPYRVILAEVFAFFIMAVLVLMGPQRAVPVFLIGGGAFTIFTIFAMGYVGINAVLDPSKEAEVEAIVCRLVQDDVVTTEHHEAIEGGHRFDDTFDKSFTCVDDSAVAASTTTGGEEGGIVGAATTAEAEEVNETFTAIFEVSTAAFFLLFFRSMSSAMLGFSGYEMIPASGKHATKPKWKVINTSLTIAAIFLISIGTIQLFAAWQWGIPATEGYSTLLIEYELVFGNTATLTIAGLLLATILLLAQGGGYVGGAAVASNAARLGRMPWPFKDDRVGIAVIWLVSAMAIPLIPSVTLVEAFYAFGFVSAFVITGTTLYFVRDDVLRGAGIEPGSREHKSLRFAAMRGMVASYAMAVVLVWQKFDALAFIIPAATVLTVMQILIARGGTQRKPMDDPERPAFPGDTNHYTSGEQRARDEARQRGVVDVVKGLVAEGAMLKFNVAPERVYRLISYTHNIDPQLWEDDPDHHDSEHFPEPTESLERVYQAAYAQRDSILATIEAHSHYGIYTFVNRYARNWASEQRECDEVEKQMLRHLLPRTPIKQVMDEYNDFHWQEQPEEVWQFSRERYQWAKNQWVNVSDRITTIWTLQDVGLLPAEMNADAIIQKISTLADGTTVPPLVAAD